MWLNEIPGRVDPAARPVIDARWRRARRWLGATVVLCWSEAVVTVALVALALAAPEALPVEHGGSPIPGLVMLLLMAVGPLVIVAWAARQAPDWPLKPHDWWQYPVFLGFVEAAALAGAMAVVGGLPWWVPALVGLVYLLLPVGATELARRALLRPWATELGGTEVELRLVPRAGERVWWNQDFVTLSGDAVRLVVRSGSGRSAHSPSQKDIPLSAITDVVARPAVAEDRAWAWLADGRGLSVTPGDVLVVGTRDGDQVIPLDEAADVAVLLGRRVEARTGRSPLRTTEPEARSRGQR